MTHREQAFQRLHKRALLAPELQSYTDLIEAMLKHGHEDAFRSGLGHLTDIHRKTYTEVLDVQKKLKPHHDAKSHRGAIMNISGNNFQSLCEFAINSWLEFVDSPVCVQRNLPKEMKDEFKIFGISNDGEIVVVTPDVDLVLWIPGLADSPVIVISAKTSLKDRAGQAARWKDVFNIIQRAGFSPEEQIEKLGYYMESRREMHHCLVTANIYRPTDKPEGELGTNQCRSNTFMFENKYTTRRDKAECRPKGWESFDQFPLLVDKVFAKYGHPIP